MKTTCWLCLALLLWLPHHASALPDRILAGQAEVRLGEVEDPWQRDLALLHDAGFSTVGVRLIPPSFDATDPEAWGTVERLARAAGAAGLELSLCLQDQNLGRRDPQAPDWLVYVGPDGRVNDQRYCLYQYSSWRHAFDRVFALATLARTLPIAAVTLDVEMLMDPAPCVCADCFGSYAEALGQPNVAVDRADRWAWIAAHGGATAYEQHLERRMEAVAGSFAAAVHAVSPKLSLGLTPYRDDFLRRPWVRHLGTAEAPAIIGSRALFTGAGYTAAVEAQGRRVRELSPYARYVPSFRVDLYRPEDLGTQAYIAGCRAGGYSLWTLSVIDPQTPQERRAGSDPLPEALADPVAYWRELGEANRRIGEWCQGPRAEVPLQALEPPMPGIDPDSALVPAVRGLYPSVGDPEGTPGPTGLRGSSTLAITVDDPAVPIAIRLQHLGGTEHTTAVAYAVVTTGGRVIEEGSLGAGTVAQLAVKVPQAGTYGLLLAAPEGGPAYSVRVSSHPYGLVAATGAGYFGQGPRQYFAVPAGTQSFRVTCGVGAAGVGRLQVFGPAGEPVADETAGPGTGGYRTVETGVPAGQDGQVWSLQVGQPTQAMPGTTSGSYQVRLEGVPPYLSDRPRAVVVPAY